METEKKENKKLIQKRAGKLLAGFFVLMLALTAISKAADSLTVAKVTTEYPQRASLNFQVFGTGTVVLGRKKYVEAMDNITVDRVYAEPGTRVKKGDALLKLSVDDLEELLSAAQDEEKKMELAIRQAQLQNSQASAGTDAAAQAQEAVRNAREDLEAAKAKEEELTKKYKEDLKKEKKDLQKEAGKALEDAETAYEDVRLANEETLETAKRSLDDAREASEEAALMDTRLKTAVDTFISSSGNYEQRQGALDALCELLYENASGGYESHKETVAEKQEAVDEAEKDLKEVKEEQESLVYRSRVKRDEAKKAHDDASPTDPDYAQKKSAYEQAQEAYEGAISVQKQTVEAAERVVKAAEKSLESVRRPEKKLENAVFYYYYSIQNKNESGQEKYWKDIRTLIYGGTAGLLRHEKELKEAQEALDRRTKDYERTKARTDRTLAAEQKKVDEARERLDSMKEGGFDYEGLLEAEKAQIESAGDQVKTLERALKTAERGVEKARKQDEDARRAAGITAQINDLSKQSAYIDLNRKKEQIAALSEMLLKKGKITAPQAGTVLEVSIEEGHATGGGPAVIIGCGGYGFEGTAEKEAAEYVGAGDPIELAFPGEKEPVTATVDHIQYDKGENGEDIARITASLPDGDYVEGRTANFIISKISEPYLCIPISAVRSDPAGDFVLALETIKGILGEELHTVRYNVIVKEKDRSKAAVEGSLTEDLEIVTGSNKSIGAGDRVRLKG